MSNPTQAHDQKSCNALKDYIDDCEKRQAAMSRNGGKHLPEIDKAAIADEWYTTAEEMDRHWVCIKKDDV